MKRVTVVLFVAVLFLAGCGVQVPGLGGGNEAPQITADQADVQQYLNEVEPILQRTAGDVAQVADVSINTEGGNVSVSADPNSLERALQETQQGLDEMRAVQPPPGLEQTHERLVNAYEEALPAVGNLIEAAQSGDAAQITSSLWNDLPKIQQLLSEIQNALQQLQAASQQPNAV